MNDTKTVERYNNELNKNVVTSYRELKDSETIDIKQPAYTSKSISYNGTRAANYALQYVIKPNPNYYDFTGIGGDCTNFVSQAIHEGGGIPKHFGGNTPLTHGSIIPQLIGQQLGQVQKNLVIIYSHHLQKLMHEILDFTILGLEM